MGIKFGYARVSTSGQSLNRQIDALKAAGVPEENIYCEKMTGTKANRPKLNALMDMTEKDDIVVIESLNRLGRSSSDLISLMQYFSDRGVVLQSLKEQLDFSTVQGKFIANFLALMAQFEREVIVERVKEGVEAARARGRIGGRPSTPAKVIDKALEMYDNRNLSVLTVTDICKACSISRPTLYKAIRQRELQKELEGK